MNSLRKILRERATAPADADPVPIAVPASQMSNSSPTNPAQESPDAAIPPITQITSALGKEKDLVDLELVEIGAEGFGLLFIEGGPRAV